MDYKKTLKICLVISIFVILTSLVLALDNDGDGMNDIWESDNGLNPNDPTDAYEDPDGDGLINIDEYKEDTDPLNKDTDGDGYLDKEELDNETDPTDETDYPQYSLNQVTINKPRFGVSPSKKFNLTVKSSLESALCKFSESPSYTFSQIQKQSNYFVTSDKFTHTVELDLSSDPDNFDRTIYIICNTTSGYVNDEFPEELIVSYDTTPPYILQGTFKASPPFVNELLNVSLSLAADEDVICKFDFSPQSYLTMGYDFKNSIDGNFDMVNKVTLTDTTNPKIEDNKNYTFYAACMNKAGGTSLNTEKVTFSVNLSSENRIVRVLPAGSISKTEFTLVIETNKNSNCYYGPHLDNKIYPEHSKVHEQDFKPPTVSEGKNVIEVICTFDLGGPSVSKTLEFYIDTIPPGTTTITSSPEVCPGVDFYATFNASDNIGVKYYNYTISRGAYQISGSTQGSVSIPINSSEKEIYSWSVYAVDNAENKGFPSTYMTTILDELNLKCEPNLLPEINISWESFGEYVGVVLDCFNPDGKYTTKCPYVGFHLVNESCNSCGACSYETYKQGTTIKIIKDTTICYNISDGRENVVGEEDIDFIGCTYHSDSCCLKTRDAVCDPDCTMAEDLDCDPEKNDTDLDGMYNIWEIEQGLNYTIDDSKLDPDKDGLDNLGEFKAGTNATNPDTDGDQLLDGEDSHPLDENLPPNPNRDSDYDGIPDSKEDICGLDPLFEDDPEDDYDNDGLTNREECITYSSYGIDANKADTDGDKRTDYRELKIDDTDPSDPESFKKNPILNIILIVAGLSSTGFGVYKFSKTDLSILKQTTGNKTEKSKDEKSEKKEQKGSNDNRSNEKSGSKLDFKNMFSKKPDVNFSKSEENLKKNTYIITQKQGFDPLNYEIAKKKREMQLKNMTSIFDEFSKESPIQEEEFKKKEKPKDPILIKQEEQKEKKEEELFGRLDDISREDAFEELEVISKKKVKKDEK